MLRVLDRLADVPERDWDALAAGATPFLRWAWLESLESSGCAAVRAGWRPRHVTVWREGRLVAAAPAYAKDGSDGDFSRDWEWAAAAERAGAAFYPKLVLGVPFTPCPGRRLLVAPGEDRGALVSELLRGARELCAAEGLGALEVLYPIEEEALELEARGLAVRVDHQFHWRNEGYRSIDDFLARFSSKRRAVWKRERAAPAKQGIEIRTVRGEELAHDPARWARDVHALHKATVDKLPWGRGWLNLRFYERVLRRMPGNVEIVEARRSGKLVAAAFNIASDTRLYGRYWGCFEEHPFLHFNVCLYHSVEECISRGIQAFEGGAGGEHKLLRGFEPAETFSAFEFRDARLDTAVRRHVALERRHRKEALERFRAGSGLLKSAAR